MAHRRIILPLDVSDSIEAEKLVCQLSQSVGVFKIGLQLFTAEGPRIITAIAERSQVFLDLKLHDIPAIVGHAVEFAAKYSVRFLTVHTSGGPTMLRTAVKAAPPEMMVLGVTVLTSLEDRDLSYMGMKTSIKELVRDLALMAWDNGVRGFVCSPLEVATLRKELPSEAILVVPGIRPAKADDDQKRVATPAKAMKAGADYLVIGRPIRSAADPVKAAKDIVDEILPFIK